MVGIEVLVDLVAGARPQDVAGSSDDVVQRVRRRAELAVDQRDAEAVEATAAEFGGHVGGVQPGVDRALLDLLHQVGRYLAQLLDLLLVREQLALGEVANGVDDHLVLVGKCEIQGATPRLVVRGSVLEKWPARCGRWKGGMGSSDGVERGAYLGEDRDRATGVHVDVHEHLLGRGQQRVVVAVEHLVVDQQALAVDAEHPRGDAQRCAFGGLAQVGDVRLDGVEAVARRRGTRSSSPM